MGPDQLDSVDNKMPELPNFISLTLHYFHDSVWAPFVHQWESLIFSILIATAICLLFSWGARKKALFPKGLQNFLELLAETLRKAVTDVLGSEGDKYLPFLATLFVYILTMNLAGLVPLLKSPSSSLNITAGLAICVFCLVQYLNIKNMGLFGFFYHLAGSPKGMMGWMMAPLMFPLELLTQFSRPFTLSLRLFGNILGGDIFIGVFVLFGLAAVSSFSCPVGLPLQLPFMFLGLLAGVMQALVFTLLTTVYILLSMPHAEEHHE